LKIYKSELNKKNPNKRIFNRAAIFLSAFDAASVGLSIIHHFPRPMLENVPEMLIPFQVWEGYVTIISAIIKAYEEGNYEELRNLLNGHEIPDQIQTAMMKKKYAKSISKVGSIPLEIFAEQAGLPINEAEKMVYDMILKGEIAARIELVDRRLYIIKEETPEEEAERKAQEEAERKAQEEAERKAQEEAERKAQEEAERKAQEEAKKKAQEEKKPKKITTEKIEKEQDLTLIPKVGKSTKERLQKAGINSIQDLIKADPKELAEKLGKGISENKTVSWIEAGKAILEK
jgi:predicted flap endonuclease-1-like 5' DNA nuclease